MSEKFVSKRVTLVMANAGAYSSGDQVGVPIVLTDILASTKGQLLLTSVNVIDYAVQSLALDLWFFKSQPTTVADNAAYSMTDANALLCVGIVQIVAGNYSIAAINSVATLGNINKMLQGIAGSKDLWMAAVTRGTPTYASGDLIIDVGGIQP